MISTAIIDAAGYAILFAISSRSTRYSICFWLICTILSSVAISARSQAILPVQSS
ncbi:hypothetical protein K437DRAFT_135752 [Tilletiaria anomala UBC 951]|uniref:Uncharacterized protein n=1 Tax=Tilletiaria anomala (strain ATCC 24038 / CBS 436.72 / UBC 951) TaxID=1037660 RepID=A0A066WQV4_TILAU|nr:uncharacterized protein K437DRAFT_135752 [Tilletiaria anomala UBC 951]KDN53025.1 hypothetical protein K437DRAFT_135752 [Tilletiaria anomala UBC 951]